MLHIDERSRVLDQLAEQAVPDTIDLWPAVRERLMLPQRTAQHMRRWTVALIAAAAVLVAAVLVGGLPWDGGPQAVNAETILDRAQSAVASGATAVNTYHLLITRTARDTDTSTSEIWFGGPDRQRTIQHMIGPNGAVVSSQDVVFRGQETWIETTDNGNTRVIHTTGTTWTRPADDPSVNANLLDAIQHFGDRSCMATQLEPTEASVAGQPAYVIGATPKGLDCGPASIPGVEASPGPAGDQPGIRVNGQPRGGLVLRPAQMTIWVDKRSFLPLRIDARDTAGVVVDRTEATSVEYNVSIADTTFEYAPRAGVAVATFTGGTGADVKRALAGSAASDSPPRK